MGRRDPAGDLRTPAGVGLTATALEPVTEPFSGRGKHAIRLHPCAGPCGRLVAAGFAWCCTACRAAIDGGWDIGAHEPGAAWTDVHTAACEQGARERDPCWYAGSAAPVWGATDG